MKIHIIYQNNNYKMMKLLNINYKLIIIHIIKKYMINNKNYK